ncbi:MAG: thioredoxin-dependent thiol peroxidase [DPANN group archaeon]|nr:thioredoxin-dependent thiol peroxidase [DPANN group archaeon]
MYPKVGGKAPEFTLKNQDHKPAFLKDFAGKWLVLYFYPKDNTSGCTAEAIDFTNELTKINSIGANVLGVSPDSEDSHCKFRDRHSLKVTLLSDPDKTVLEKYGVWQEKSMYGRKYMGVVRTTFLIDPQGKVAHVWEKVKVPGHVQDVIDTLAKLK